jgi:hypothetical protein
VDQVLQEGLIPREMLLAAWVVLFARFQVCICLASCSTRRERHAALQRIVLHSYKFFSAGEAFWLQMWRTLSACRVGSQADAWRFWLRLCCSVGQTVWLSAVAGAKSVCPTSLP